MLQAVFLRCSQLTVLVGAQCRVCQNQEHNTQNCPVMAAATGAAGAPIPQPGPQRSLRKAVETPEWLDRVPERTKSTMVGLQNLAALYCLRAQGAGNMVRTTSSSSLFSATN